MMDSAIARFPHRFRLALTLFTLAGSISLTVYSSTSPAVSAESHRES
jgi:hypothetical protein